MRFVFIGGGAAISLTDENEADDLAVLTQLNFVNLVGGGPHNYAILGWRSANTGVTVSSASWGSSMTVGHKYAVDIGGASYGVAFLYIAGTPNDDLIVNMSGTNTYGYVQTVALSGLVSGTPSDTDDATISSEASKSLTALTLPSPGGIRLAGLSLAANNDPTWANADELSDQGGAILPRFSSAWRDNSTSSDIGASFTSTSGVIAGISLR